MQTDAFDLEVPAVEPEARIRFKVRIPNTVRHRLIVPDCLAAPNWSNDASDDTIKVGVVQVPAPRILNRDVLRESCACAGGNVLVFRCDSWRRASVRIEHGHLQRQSLRHIRLIDNLSLHTHGCFVSSNLRCGYEGSPLRYPNWIGDNQVNVPINTCACVPA